MDIKPVKFKEEFYTTEDVLIGGLLSMVSEEGYEVAMAKLKVYIATGNPEYIPKGNGLRGLFAEEKIPEYVKKNARLKSQSEEKFVANLYKKNAKGVEQLDSMVEEFKYIYNKVQTVTPRRTAGRVKYLVERFNELTVPEKFYIKFQIANFDRVSYVIQTSLDSIAKMEYEKAQAEQNRIPTPQVDAVMGRNTAQKIPNNFATAPRAESPKVNTPQIDVATNRYTHEVNRPDINAPQPTIAADIYAQQGNHKDPVQPSPAKAPQVTNTMEDKNKVADPIHDTISHDQQKKDSYKDYIPKDAKQTPEPESLTQEHGKDRNARKRFKAIIEKYNEINNVEDVKSVSSVIETRDRCTEITDRLFALENSVIAKGKDVVLDGKIRAAISSVLRYQNFLTKYKCILAQYQMEAESSFDFNKQIKLLATMKQLSEKDKKDIPPKVFKEIKKFAKFEKGVVFEEAAMMYKEESMAR